MKICICKNVHPTRKTNFDQIKCDIGLGLDVHSEVCINGAERILVASQIQPIQLRNDILKMKIKIEDK